MTEMEKCPLTYSEHQALRLLFASTSTISDYRGGLEKRLRSLGEQEKMERVEKDLFHLLGKVASTVPEERMEAFKVELRNIRIWTELRRNEKASVEENATYVPTDALERVIDRAISVECYGCERKGGEIGKCQLRKDVQQLYHYDFPKATKACPLAGASLGFLESDTDE